MELKLIDPRLKTFEPETVLSAGYDLRCCEDDEVIILPGQTVKVHTGIAVHMGATHLPYSPSELLTYCALIMPRSSLGCRGIKPKNVPGLIDADYQGEIMLCMTNESEEFVTIQPMDRIAQLVFMLALQPRFMKVTHFSTDTDRGVNGFGSTGVN
jgi:dUTP pyrophosphatase